MSQIDLGSIDKIIDKSENIREEPTREELIQILQDVDSEYNYLPEEGLKYIARRLNIPLSNVYSVATFYKAFSLEPRGRHSIKVCLGTACHVRSGVKILESLERKLGVTSGATTNDLKFTLETVRCIGCCSLGPVIRVDADTHGRLTQDKLLNILKKYD